ncbi:MAG: DUF262 domain-containing protein [Scytolyngbya sp. HA4215-MV1]|jgi:hypothetical protein|nr:DUF262 domain-containing protein [Scytolyngbya sp. HA4215-MV1]
MDVNQQQAENLDETSLGDLSQNKNFEDNDTGIEIEEEEIVEPFDPTKIKIDARQITIDLVLNRIRFGEIELSPDFQRESNIWNDTAKSRLIESMLIRIPLPAFYIDATDEDKWVVIDGQQRLTTVKQFVIGGLNGEKDQVNEDKEKFRLSKLEFLTQFNGKSYDELPRNYQRRINETQITIYLIEKGTPEELKFNIFRRINTGGLPLSSQEIRHALNQGKVTKFLEKLAVSKEFKKATANGVPDKRMAAREVVLRFLAFKITPFPQYNATELDTFLNGAMKTMNYMSDEDLERLERDFLRTMLIAADIFGNDAFRKRFDRKATRSQVNKALFESWSVNLSSLNDRRVQKLKSRKNLLLNEFIKLMNEDLYFVNSISQGTGDIRKVKYRFSKIQELISEVLEAEIEVAMSLFDVKYD